MSDTGAISSGGETAASEHLGVGSLAPAFTLPDQDGKPVSLTDLRGKIVVLFFYPKAFTHGCTAEACSFKDGYGDLKDLGATLLGVSQDDPGTQRSFAEQHGLPFQLLSDHDGRVQRLYGVSRTFGLIPGRRSFVIDRGGRIVHVFNSQFRPKAHVEEAIRAVRKLEAVPG